MGGSRMDQTDDFQKLCESGLDRIQLLWIRIGLGLKNFTVRSSLIQTLLITVVKCLIIFFRISTGLDQIFGPYYRIRIGLNYATKILEWNRFAKISDSFNTKAHTLYNAGR